MPDFKLLDIRVVIPALNEARVIADVVRTIPSFVKEVIVVDNGSTDGTGARAREAGARIIRVEKAGYGRSCLAGMAAAGPCDIIVFMDGDGSDVAAEMTDLVEPIAADEADFVIGARTHSRTEKGALTPQQRYGNRLACFLMRLLWKGGFTDLGPFRAVRRTTLERLKMENETFGWTVEMQVRALKTGVRSIETPVSYRKRVGKSKISGTVRGVILAGAHILGVIAREALSGNERLKTAPQARHRETS